MPRVMGLPLKSSGVLASRAFSSHSPRTTTSLVTRQVLRKLIYRRGVESLDLAPRAASRRVQSARLGPCIVAAGGADQSGQPKAVVLRKAAQRNRTAND